MYEPMDGEVGAAPNAGMARKGIAALARYGSGARSFHDAERPIETPRTSPA